MNPYEKTLYYNFEDISSDNKDLDFGNKLQRVHSWLIRSTYKMSLNVKKTKYMLFCKNKNKNKQFKRAKLTKYITTLNPS